MLNVSPAVTQGRKTKSAVKQDLQGRIDKAYAECKARIDEMAEQASHPQIAKMIERNKGYMAALEDVTELLYSRNVF